MASSMDSSETPSRGPSSSTSVCRVTVRVAGAPAFAEAPPLAAFALSALARREPPITRSLERVLELAAGHRDVDLGDRLALDGAGQDLLADAREQRVGEDGVDHA